MITDDEIADLRRTAYDGRFLPRDTLLCLLDRLEKAEAFITSGTDEQGERYTAWRKAAGKNIPDYGSGGVW